MHFSQPYFTVVRRLWSLVRSMLNLACTPPPPPGEREKKRKNKEGRKVRKDEWDRRGMRKEVKRGLVSLMFSARREWMYAVLVKVLC